MFDTSLGLCIKFYTNLGYRGSPCSVSEGKGWSAGAPQNLLQAQPTAGTASCATASLGRSSLLSSCSVAALIHEPDVLKGHFRSTALKTYQVLHVLSVFIFR